MTEAQEARDEGMSRVLHHTPADYKAAFKERFTALLFGQQPFTSRDVVETVGYPPGSENAIGALMNSCVAEAKREGVIEHVGWTNTDHKAGHHRTTRIYRGDFS